jgi:hypothetical protein
MELPELLIMIVTYKDMNWLECLPFVRNLIMEAYDINNIEMDTTELNTTIQSTFTLLSLHRVYRKIYAMG